ncbi:MAG: DUF2807 domain-containing protein [Bacteroidales bacterium]|nr:DUF2807 domain-containing protein [Bacteroidales bacterium]
MKKLLFAVAAMLCALSSLSAESVANDKYVTKDYDLKDFTGIVASGIYEVQLVKSNTWKVSVSVPEPLEDYLDVRVINGKLVLAMKSVPVKISKNYGKWNLTAKVAIPVLKSVHLSGASKLECADSFDIGGGTFKLEVSGASKANGLDIIARELDMEMGGATSASLSGTFEHAEIEMGGASKCNFDIDADRLDQELSGAAKAYHSGEFTEVDVEASGACLFSFKGSADKMDIEGSGAAKIESSKGSARDVKASISGAAYAEINALENLLVEVSGGGSIRYVDNDRMDLNIRSISRGASVSKMK